MTMILSHLNILLITKMIINSHDLFYEGGLMNRKTLSIFGDKICELPLTHLQNVMYSVGKGWANTVAGKLPFCGFMTALDHLTSMDVHHVLNKSALD